MNLIAESTFTLLNSWKRRIEAEDGLADIRIDEYMRSFSGDVISRACFGSNYSRGEEIFLKLRALQEVMSKKSLSTGVPRMRLVFLCNFMSYLSSTDLFTEIIMHATPYL